MKLFKIISIAFILSVFTLSIFSQEIGIQLKASSQTLITAGAGYSLTNGAVAELKIGHSINNHSLAVIGVAHLSDRQPEYAGLCYSYTIAQIIQPYFGYGYQKSTSDHKSVENTWKANYGIQINYKPNEDAPAGLYINAGGIGSEVMVTGGIHLKF